MPFRPNLQGYVYRSNGYDFHGREQLSAKRKIPFAQVNLKSEIIETSVRADSSASRGSADQISNGMAAILVPANVDIQLDDFFEFEGIRYRVISHHPRRSVGGRLDHYQCGLSVEI